MRIHWFRWLLGMVYSIDAIHYFGWHTLWSKSDAEIISTGLLALIFALAWR